MVERRAEELLATLAAAVVEADALEAARRAHALPKALEAEAEELLSRIQPRGDAAAALSELGRLLDGDRSAARAPAAGRVERDTETVDLIGDFIEESTEALTRADELLLAIE